MHMHIIITITNINMEAKILFTQTINTSIHKLNVNTKVRINIIINKMTKNVKINVRIPIITNKVTKNVNVMNKMVKNVWKK